MSRARSGKTVLRSRKRLRKLTKGFRQSRHNLYRQAVVTLLRARVYAYRDRRARKGDFRSLWIQRINAAARSNGMTYNRFIQGLKAAGVEIDRKNLAELAVAEPAAFAALVEIARSALPAASTSGGESAA